MITEMISGFGLAAVTIIFLVGLIQIMLWIRKGLDK